jgi:hypothetical protein
MKNPQSHTGGAAPGRVWSEAEDALILANRDLVGDELKPLFDAAGYNRTANGIDKRRSKLGVWAPVNKRNRDGQSISAGWPQMRGSEEWRDARFVGAVWAEARRLGLVGDTGRRAA